MIPGYEVFGGYAAGELLTKLFFFLISASSLIIQRRISTMIKRFKFEELECDVMPIFPEITWGRVKSKLIRNHKKFTTTNAVHIIQEVINVRTILVHVIII